MGGRESVPRCLKGSEGALALEGGYRKMKEMKIVGNWDRSQKR